MGGGNAPIRKIGNEFPQILQLLNHTFGGKFGGTLNQFLQSQPLLQLGQNQALNFERNVGQFTNPLTSIFNSATSGPISNQFSQWNNQLGGYSNQLGGLNQALGGYRNQLGGLNQGLSNISNTLAAPIAGLQSSYNANIAPILASGGALTPEQVRDVTQQTDASFAARGLGTGGQAITSEFLNRQAAQQQRYQTALSEGQGIQSEIGGIEGERSNIAQLQSGIIGQQTGITGQQANIIGQQTGITGLEEGLLQNRVGLQTGLANSIQGLQSNAINQGLGVENALTGNYANLVDPWLGYAGNIFQGNQNAQLQQGLANQNKDAGLASAGIKSVGSIIGSIIPASDKRLKEKIKDIGEKTPEGIPIKTFQFKGDPGKNRYIGVIAQDVKKHAPHAVLQGPDGFMRVNFSAIHAPYHQIGSSSGRRTGSSGFKIGSDKGRQDAVAPIEDPSRAVYSGPRVILGSTGGDFYGDSPRDSFWYNSNFSNWGTSPPIGTPGWLQGPTRIDTLFDSQGYPYAVPINNPSDPVGLLHAGQHINTEV